MERGRKVGITFWLTRNPVRARGFEINLEHRPPIIGTLSKPSAIASVGG
jgi:hypothetical protein